MNTSSPLADLEQVCSQINTLQNTLSNLDSDLTSFDKITTKLNAINTVFPSSIENDLTIFYQGLTEVDSMIVELNKVTLNKLSSILQGADAGIAKLISPIPNILSDIKSISTLFPTVQAQVAKLTDPAEGVEATLKPLESQLASWSNTTPQSSGSNIGTGVLNAIDAEMNRAIQDNITLKHKYDSQINSIVSQLNTMAGALTPYVTNLSTDGSNLDSQISSVNTFLTDYLQALNSVSSLASKVETVVSLLDKFKPDVDLIYGIVQPLGWFISLIESQSCSSSTTLTDVNVNLVEHRLAHYADASASPQSKFQLFEMWVDNFFSTNNIGQKIQQVVDNLLPISALSTAADQLNTDLMALNKNASISNLLTTFTQVASEISGIENELAILSTDAVKATGTVVLSRTHPNAEVTLLKGTRMSNQDGSLSFVTTENCVFAQGQFNSPAVKATAQAVGTSSNLGSDGVTEFVSTPVKQADGSYKNEGNGSLSDSYSVSSSTPFSGGTDISVNQIQGEADALAQLMLPTLMRLMNKNEKS